MGRKEFKSLFDEVAKAHGFQTAHGGWYLQRPAALMVLSLQKSNFGHYFELNIKILLRHTSPRDPAAFKRHVKTLSGDVFRRQPPEYDGAFDLEQKWDRAGRHSALDAMFRALVDRIGAALTEPAGILRLRDEGLLFVLPNIEARLRELDLGGESLKVQ